MTYNWRSAGHADDLFHKDRFIFPRYEDMPAETPVEVASAKRLIFDGTGETVDLALVLMESDWGFFAPYFPAVSSFNDLKRRITYTDLRGFNLASGWDFIPLLCSITHPEDALEYSSKLEFNYDEYKLCLDDNKLQQGHVISWVDYDFIIRESRLEVAKNFFFKINKPFVGKFVFNFSKHNIWSYLERCYSGYELTRSILSFFLRAIDEVHYLVLRKSFPQTVVKFDRNLLSKCNNSLPKKLKNKIIKDWEKIFDYARSLNYILEFTDESGGKIVLPPYQDNKKNLNTVFKS